MKVLLSWMSEFAPFNEATTDPTIMADHLSDLGLSVEEMRILGADFSDVVVARVLETKPHPNADRIHLVEVDDGSGISKQICCGAFNMTAGDLVPLAVDGATVAGGMKIKRRKMRGERSEGMLCSATELGLPAGEGILILPSDLEVGVDVAGGLGITEDVFFDLEVNPNRPDAMSVAGVARDLAARLRLPFQIPTPDIKAPASRPPVTIDIQDPDFCGHFTVMTMGDVKVGESPAWLVGRLQALGMRAVNSLVDISNFVMLELGQPTHAFDMDKIGMNKIGDVRNNTTDGKIADSKIPSGKTAGKTADNKSRDKSFGKFLGVRLARDKETLETLDGQVRELSAEDGIITGADDAPLSLAGVMGGASTEISGDTTIALIEAAWWDPMRISRTARRLGLRSEASMRFERGVDPEIAELALLRFAELAEQLGVAKLSSSVSRESGNLPNRPKVKVRTERVCEMLGMELRSEEIAEELMRMGFSVEEGVGGQTDSAPTGTASSQAGSASASASTGASTSASANTPTSQLVGIPSWRLDCETEIDVIEEVARGYGYSRIPKIVPVIKQTGSLTSGQETRRQLRHLLCGMGLSETISLPFLAPEDIATSGGKEGEALEVQNPLAVEESVLRSSLRPGMLKVAAYNYSRRIENMWLFEIGHVFTAKPANADTQALPQESEHLAIMLCGESAPQAVKFLRKLLASLGLVDQANQITVRNMPQPGMHPSRSGEVQITSQASSASKMSPASSSSTPIGSAGELDPQILEKYELVPPVAWCEINLDLLLDELDCNPKATYKPPTRYPSSDIDLAFLLPDETPVDVLQETIAQAAGEHLAEIYLFDVFRSDQLPGGARSLAFRLRFEAADRTLTDEEVATVRLRCIDVAQKVGAELRAS